MVIKKEMTIIPDKVIWDNKIREISKLDKSLWIKGFEIHLDENKNIEKVILDGKHPNADPETSVFCLSEEVIGKPFEKIGFPALYCFMSLWNLDRCYFRPWDKFELSK